MNIVELYSGSSNFSNEMRKRGHNVIDIDINPNTKALKHLDVSKLTLKDLENMFENHKIDFIFSAPDVYAYFGVLNKPTKEELLFRNILNICNCGFIVEQVSFATAKKYRVNTTTIDLTYEIFDDESNRISHLVTNLSNFEKYLRKRLKKLKPIKNDKMENFKGGTPHQLIMIIADFIDGEYKNGKKI